MTIFEFICSLRSACPPRRSTAIFEGSGRTTLRFLLPCMPVLLFRDTAPPPADSHDTLPRIDKRGTRVGDIVLARSFEPITQRARCTFVGSEYEYFYGRVSGCCNGSAMDRPGMDREAHYFDASNASRHLATSRVPSDQTFRRSCRYKSSASNSRGN